MHLIVQYYAESDPQRREELHYCMRRNLAHPRVECIHDLQTAVSPPPEILGDPKYRQVAPSDWLTFQRAFEYANAHLQGEVVGLLNLDIFLDAEFDPDAFARYPPQAVLALARWEYSPEKQVSFFDPDYRKLVMSHTQDAWVFRPPLQVQACDFPLGVLTCDNAIAHRLHSSGYLPVNDCFRFRIHHYDVCRGKTARNAVQFHRKRTQTRRYPHEEGQRLLPWRPDPVSLDQLADSLGLTDLERYQWACEIYNSRRKLEFTSQQRQRD